VVKSPATISLAESLSTLREIWLLSSFRKNSPTWRAAFSRNLPFAFPSLQKPPLALLRKTPSCPALALCELLLSCAEGFFYLAPFLKLREYA
jgi:hypothetical protein